MNFLHYLYSIKFLILLWLILIYLIYRTGDKEYKLSYKNKYYTSLPSNLTPTQVQSLINYGLLSPRDVVANGISLINQGVLVVTKTKNNRLQLSLNKDLSKVSSLDKDFTDWIFSVFKNRQTIDLNLFLKPSPDFIKSIQFRKSFKLWSKKIRNSLTNKDLFSEKRTGRYLGFILGVIYFVLSLFLTFYFKRYSYLITLILGIITIIYSLHIVKRTPNGQYQYELWLAFKRYLRDIAIVEKNNKLSSALIEMYLPYAISFGIHSKLITYLKENYEYSELSELKIYEILTLDEFEELLNKIIKSSELALISPDFE